MTQPTNEQEMRELDTCVAFKVMGYLKWHPKCMHAAEGRGFYNPKTGTLHRWLDDVGPMAEGFFPSTDPAAAMLVLEKCCDRVCLMVWRSGTRWYCNLTTGGDLLGEAETLPLAICRFSKSLFERSKSR